MPAPEILKLLEHIRKGAYGSLARGITIVENELDGAEELLLQLNNTQKARVVGITGPPGAGKSTLVNALLEYWVNEGKRIAVLAVDPSSPFHFGSLLGDRIRMTRFYTNPNVFIRSLASRGSLGGLHPHIFEIADLVKEAGFDIIVIETVGVGQSEVEIAGLADCTVVTLVPEAGDTIQTMKAGLLEIADLFVVNKSDRPDADKLYQSLKILAHERAGEKEETPVFKTIASSGAGIQALSESIDKALAAATSSNSRHAQLVLEKVYRIIQKEMMKPFSKEKIAASLAAMEHQKGTNLYSLARLIAREVHTSS